MYVIIQIFIKSVMHALMMHVQKLAASQYMCDLSIANGQPSVMTTTS